MKIKRIVFRVRAMFVGLAILSASMITPVNVSASVPVSAEPIDLLNLLESQAGNELNDANHKKIDNALLGGEAEQHSLTQTAPLPASEIPLNQPATLERTNPTDTAQKPQNFAQIPGLEPCSVGKREMNIVAHQDDDLLFMNPDIQSGIDTSRCQTTIFVTAGDNNQAADYAESRVQGVIAAYDSMLAAPPQAWSDSTVNIGDKTVRIVTNTPSRSVSLVFMYLPDGNLDGAGFASTGQTSLTKVINGELAELSTINGYGVYNRTTLVETIAKIMEVYSPSVVRTQSHAPENVGADHADHIAVGQISAEAVNLYHRAAHHKTQNYAYLGYPISARPETLSANALQRKSDAFFAYAAHDAFVCPNLEVCVASGSGYPSYLSRLYSSKV